MTATMDPARVTFAQAITRRFTDWKQCLLIEYVQFKGEARGFYQELMAHLDKHMDLYKECHFIFIEEQPVINLQSSLIAQTILVHLLNKLAGTGVVIVMVDNQLKGRWLGIANKYSKKELKKQVCDWVMNDLAQEGDQWTIECIKKYSPGKWNHMTDALCQEKAFLATEGIYPNASYSEWEASQQLKEEVSADKITVQDMKTKEEKVKVEIRSDKKVIVIKKPIVAKKE